MGLILDFWGSHFDKLNDFLDSGGRTLERPEIHMQHLPVCAIPKGQMLFW